MQISKRNGKVKMNMDKLKQLRKMHNYSCFDMGQKLNISRVYYWQIENGRRNLYYSMAVKIAKVFNLKPDDVFYGD